MASSNDENPAGVTELSEIGKFDMREMAGDGSALTPSGLGFVGKLLLAWLPVLADDSGR